VIEASALSGVAFGRKSLAVKAQKERGSSEMMRLEVLADEA
jgi:hypothetical protein